MSRDAINVEHEIYDCSGNNWNYRNSKKSFKETFENHTRNTFNRFPRKSAILGTSRIKRKELQSEI
jgi:hypothetical protein